MPDLAAKAEAELSDPVGPDELEQFGRRYGVSAGTLMSRMGGSP
jgi:hypothetical protein